MQKTTAIVVTCLVTVATGSVPARADSFDVRPITIETRDGLGLVVVTNPGDKRIYLETQVLDWMEDAAGHEHTTESTTAVASPPAMWVQPHTSYTLRVRFANNSPDLERAYRVVIRQLPARDDVVGGRIVFALTQNLPAFMIPSTPAPPALSARLDDSRHLLIANSGGRRVRITGLRQDGRQIASGLLGYVLANGSLALAVNQPVQPGTIDIETDLGRQSLGIR